MAQNYRNLFKGLKKGKSKKNAVNNYDIMNPEASDPNAQRLSRQVGKEALKTLKKALKRLKKFLEEFIKALIKAGPLGIILLILLIILVVQIAYQHIPGQMKSKLKEIFGINFNTWFSNAATVELEKRDNEDIVDVANYLEEMGYSLVGDGFVRPKLKNDSGIVSESSILAGLEDPTSKYYGWTYRADEADSNKKYHFYNTNNEKAPIKYYDGIGQTIDNVTGEVFSGYIYTDEYGIRRKFETSDSDNSDESSNSNNGKGKVAEIENIKISRWNNGFGNTDYVYGQYDNLKNYKLIRTYLLSNYRIYTLKNTDEGLLNKIGAALRMVTGGDSDGWAKGLIKLYNAENGNAYDHWWNFLENIGDSYSISGTNLSLKNGLFNNAMNFSIEGWAPRYGMSLEFLLSLHLGTNAPDLVYAMLQNFDTEIQVYLDDSGESKVDSKYVDPGVLERNNSELSEITLDDIRDILNNTNHDISKNVINDNAAFEWANSLVLSKDVCQDILEDGKFSDNENERKGRLMSPSNCLGSDPPSEYVALDACSPLQYEDNDYDSSIYNGEETYSNLRNEIDSYSGSDATFTNNTQTNNLNGDFTFDQLNNMKSFNKDNWEEQRDVLNDDWTIPQSEWNYKDVKKENKEVEKYVTDLGFGSGTLHTNGTVYHGMLIEIINRYSWIEKEKNGVTEANGMTNGTIPGAEEDIRYTWVMCKGIFLNFACNPNR